MSIAELELLFQLVLLDLRFYLNQLFLPRGRRLNNGLPLLKYSPLVKES